MRLPRLLLPHLVLPLVLVLPLLVLLTPTSAQQDFATCVSSSGSASIFSSGGAGFATAANRALYPSPATAFVVDVASRDEIRGVLACAAGAGLGVCPRSGGHSFVGQSSCEGVVVDLWRMKGVEIGEGVAEVEVGASQAEMLFYVLEKSGGRGWLG